jgi:hypothetical protein
MHSFKDNAGREWFLKGDYLTYDRVRAATGVKLYDITTEDRASLTQLADPMTLGAVLWTMIEPQAVDRDVTPEGFYGAFDGTVAHEAHDALVSEMIFFCHPNQRAYLELAYRKVREAEAKAVSQVERMLPAMEREVDQMIDQLTYGDSATSWPASSASGPITGRSANCIGPPAVASATNGTIPPRSSRRSRKSTATQRSGRGHTTRAKSTP